MSIPAINQYAETSAGITRLGGQSGTMIRIAAGAVILMTATLTLPVPVTLALAALMTMLAFRTGRPDLSSRLRVLSNPMSVEIALRECGRSHISSFASVGRKQAVEVGGAVVAFSTAGRAAVVAGDPLTIDANQPRAIREFTDLMESQGQAACFYQTRTELREAYRQNGMRVIKFGEEAVVNLTSFSLEGSARGNLRREVGRAKRAGLHVEVTPASLLDETTVKHLQDLSHEWSATHGHTMTFSMGTLQDSTERNALIAICRDDSGAVHAFTTWLHMGADGIALDLMRRMPRCGPGAVDMCIAETLLNAKEMGIHIASLGLVAFRDELGNAADGWLAAKIRNWIFRHGLRGYQYASLAAFKQKFAPEWVSRDIAYKNAGIIRIVLSLALVHSRKVEPANNNIEHAYAEAA